MLKNILHDRTGNRSFVVLLVRHSWVSMIMCFLKNGTGGQLIKEAAAVRLPLSRLTILLLLPLSRLTILPLSLPPLMAKLKSHCVISASCTNSCCYSLWPEKVKSSSILKRHKPPIITTQAYRGDFAILIHCSCSVGCSASGSRENAHLMVCKRAE